MFTFRFAFPSVLTVDFIPFPRKRWYLKVVPEKTVTLMVKKLPEGLAENFRTVWRAVHPEKFPVKSKIYTLIPLKKN